MVVVIFAGERTGAGTLGEPQRLMTAPPASAVCYADVTVVRLQHADGKQPVWLQCLVQISPTPHFVAFSQAVLFRGTDITLVWQPLLAMLAIGEVYFAVALTRFRKVIFGS